jgi:predicted metal-dependent RNase
MKTLKTILVVIFLSAFVQVNAQNPEKQAKKFTDNITEALSLTKEESDAVYKIQLARFKEAETIRTEFEGNEDTRKEKLKELGNKVFNEMKTLLGKDRMKQWNEFRTKKNN